MSHAALSDLALLHAFQQRALCARCGTVDLVRKQDVCKHRSGMEDKLAFVLPVNARACDIRRQQVRRKLDTGKLAAQ